VLDVDRAISLLKDSVEKQYGGKGKSVVDSNIAAIDRTVASIQAISIAPSWRTCDPTPPRLFPGASLTSFMQEHMLPFDEMRSSDLTTSQLVPLRWSLAPDGYGTTQFEKRGLAIALPVWDAGKCVQCNLCAVGCSHAVIRPLVLRPGSGLPAVPSRHFPAYQYRIDVSPYDCLSCGTCVDRYPALAFAPETEARLRDMEALHVAGEALPDAERLADADPQFRAVFEARKFTADGSQYFRPLVEYSGACVGCQETLYAKLLTQLFGARLVAANSIGCSSVWGGTYPSMAYRTTRKGQGIACRVSLFEDTAEFGLGIYTEYTHRRNELRDLVVAALKRSDLPADFRAEFTHWIDAFYDGDETLKISDRVNDMLARNGGLEFLRLIREHADLFCKPSFWIIAGDGWANDIGFAGLDHVMASGADVNILVYGNEAYANTGFQMSKATPRSAVVKFAATGKDKAKKGLAIMTMQYKDAFVANCAVAADPGQTIRAMKQAEAHRGPALINGYTAWIGQGIKAGMGTAHRQARLAVESGYAPLFRRLPDEGFVLDSKGCNEDALREMLQGGVRYEVLERTHKDRFDKLHNLLTEDIAQRWKVLLHSISSTDHMLKGRVSFLRAKWWSQKNELGGFRVDLPELRESSLQNNEHVNQEASAAEYSSGSWSSTA
jgi:pyruvate-ferredoxin/flavodoxin oxidoreductase